MKNDSHPEGDEAGFAGCGVHAFKTKSGVLSYGANCILNPIAVGTVALWGTVIEHELGYRAQFGRVYSIDAIFGEKPPPRRWFRKPQPSTMLENLRQLYGV